LTLRHRSLPISFATIAAATLLTLAADEALAPPAPPLPAAEAASCVPDETFAMPARDPAQAVLVKFLSRRYLIAAEATERMVGAAYHAARKVGLDPLLVLAVISVESRFNPIAESVVGAKGLMQIIPKYHQSKLVEEGGEAALLDPESNIRVGTQILQEYVYRTGTLEAGLQYYNGAFSDGSALYAQKVMAERDRLLGIVQHASGVAAVAMRGS
jgi:soluble lytic murein transglycosylase-like protein